MNLLFVRLHPIKKLFRLIVVKVEFDTQTGSTDHHAEAPPTLRETEVPPWLRRDVVEVGQPIGFELLFDISPKAEKLILGLLYPLALTLILFCLLLDIDDEFARLWNRYNLLNLKEISSSRL